ncbi:MAG: DUF2207 domain-containing protein [Christensenella sp.]|nr:DUF2207 domain-containing protein [Christensenella sp.]
MKKLLALVVVAVLLLVPCAGLAAEDTSGAAAYTYVIEDYNRVITVNENNTYDVHDTMKVNLLEPAHGLRVDIPVKAEISRISNGQIYNSTYNVLVSNMSANDSFQTDLSDGVLRMYIGDEDTYVSGEKTYEFRYRFDPGDDGISSFDEFYFNLIAPAWAAPIEKFSFTVNMPKEFDVSKIGFSTGTQGNSGYNTDAVKYEVNGNTITGSISQEVAPYEGFTMRIELPEGYYVGVRTAQSMVMPYIIAGIVVVALVFLLLILSGAKKKEIQTVEFNAPEGMNPADVGYIIDGIVENKDVVSLLIYWADEGLIAIHQKSKNDLSFEKLKDLPAGANDYERILFDKMFATGDKISVESMRFNFSGTIAACKARITEKYKMPENRVFTKKSLTFQKIASTLAPVPTAFMAACFAYVGSFEVFLGIVTFAVVWAIGVFISSNICSNINKWKSEKFSSKIGYMALSIILLAAYCAIIALLSAELFGIWAILFVLFTIIMMFLAPQFRRRTDRGAQWAGRILGLKHFIETVEADKLKMMVEDDPSYFYHILPYAYVLGVSDKWAKQFEQIAIEPPNWYYGYNGSLFTTIWFTSMISHSMTYAQQSMVMTKNSGGSGGGIGGGGGFSGGGFSGGGFGGGGGTW